MNWILPCILVIYVGTITIENVQAAEISIPSPLPLRIDKNLRKALLKALEKLDAEDTNTSETRNSEEDEEILDTSTDKNELDSFSDKLPITVKEQEDEEEIKADVFFHSVSSTPITKTKETNPQKNLIKPANNGINTGRSLDTLLNHNLNDFSSSISIINRSTDPKFYKLNQIDHPSSTIKVPVTQKTSLSSPNPTSSTPVEDGESNVKVEDVQFIHAPLVAAFTVQQDDKGLPQKVIPLFGSKPTKNQIKPFVSLEETQKNLEQHILYLQQQRRQEEVLLKRQEELKKQVQKETTDSQRNFERQQFNQEQQKAIENLNNFDRQRFQEQQKVIGNSQVSFGQQRFQEQQSVQKATDNFERFQQQQSAQKPAITFERQRLQEQATQKPVTSNFRYQLDQQLPTQISSLSFNNGLDIKNSQLKGQQLPVQQNRFSFDNQQQTKVQNLPVFNSESTKQQSTIISPSSITIQPSLSFQPSRFTSGIVPNTLQYNELRFAGQQPPIKEAVNFQQSQSIPFFSNNIYSQQLVQLPQQLPQFVQQGFAENFAQSLRTQLPPLRPNEQNPIRVFRQDSQTGNFGLNDFSNNRYQQNPFSNVQSVRSNSISLNRPFEARQFFNSQGHNQLNIDNRLKNLFYQSGFGQGRSQEDFNIVSKVLALDHSR